MTNEKVSSRKLSSTVKAIADEVADGFSRLCCCCFNPNSSRQFLWQLFKKNSFVTVGYFLLYFAFGTCIGFMGPTLEDLACYIKEEVKVVSWAFFSQTCCMVVGVFLGGLLAKRLVSVLITHHFQYIENNSYSNNNNNRILLFMFVCLFLLCIKLPI